MASTGPLTRLNTFTKDVKAELLKCTWPTWPELIQSTLVVVVSFLILGVFVSLADALLRWLVQVIF